MIPIETTTARFHKMENHLWKFVARDGAEDTLETAKENVSVIAKVFEETKIRIRLIIDLRKFANVNKQARAFYGSDEVTRTHRALAFIIDSGFSRVIGNFYLGLNKPKIPTKLFTKEEDAIEWLKEFRDE